MNFDIVIVGAGPAGLSFARSLAGSGLQLALVEAQDAASLENPPFDGREIALTHHSAHLLRQLWASGSAFPRTRSTFFAMRRCWTVMRSPACGSIMPTAIGRNWAF